MMGLLRAASSSRADLMVPLFHVDPNFDLEDSDSGKDFWVLSEVTGMSFPELDVAPEWDDLDSGEVFCVLSEATGMSFPELEEAPEWDDLAEAGHSVLTLVRAEFRENLGVFEEEVG